MAKQKRKGLSKKTRFEVFKRDHFSCQYCGKTPPAVVLEVDHLNLITACFECNRGKAAGDLAAVLPPIADQMRLERERASQVFEFNQLLMDLRNDTAQALARLGEYWFDRFMPPQENWGFAGPGEASSAKFPPRQDYWDRTFKYFCGCCWREIKKDGVEQ